LRDCSIYAPAGGHVQKRWVDEGSLLIPGSSIFTVVDNSRLELECVVPSYYLPSIKSGQEAEFTTPSWGDKTFKGVLSAINPMVQPENRSLVVKVKVQNPEMKLRSGMYARGFIATGKITNVPVIPNDALIPEEGESSEYADVFVVEGGVVKRRRIRLGGKGQDKVWVQGGLNAGDLLVIERGPSLEEGLRVRVETDNTESGS
jgi:membrane fusion protein (multidrug efflux system)